MFSEGCIIRLRVEIGRTSPLGEVQKEELLKKFIVDAYRKRGRYTEDTDWSFSENESGIILEGMVGEWISSSDYYYDDFRGIVNSYFHTCWRDLYRCVQNIQDVRVSYEMFLYACSQAEHNAIGVVKGWNVLPQQTMYEVLKTWVAWRYEDELEDYARTLRLENPDTFDQLWASGNTFYQVAVDDRCCDYNESTRPIYSVASEEERDSLVNYMRESNDTLEAYADQLMDVYREYYGGAIRQVDTFPRVRDNIGFCNISKLERSRLLEEADDMIDMGPFRGAFEDEEDYWRWKEGPNSFS